MRLRGHHLFCTALFSGHGYDRAFTEKMKETLSALEAGKPMELGFGPDELCAACPNRREDGGCELGTENVLQRDGDSFAVLGLEPGTSLNWKEAGERLAQVTDEEFFRVCGDCRWQKAGLCSPELLRERCEARAGGLQSENPCDKMNVTL